MIKKNLHSTITLLHGSPSGCSAGQQTRLAGSSGPRKELAWTPAGPRGRPAAWDLLLAPTARPCHVKVACEQQNAACSWPLEMGRISLSLNVWKVTLEKPAKGKKEKKNHAKNNPVSLGLLSQPLNYPYERERVIIMNVGIVGTRRRQASSSRKTPVTRNPVQANPKPWEKKTVYRFGHVQIGNWVSLRMKRSRSTRCPVFLLKIEPGIVCICAYSRAILFFSGLSAHWWVSWLDSAPTWWSVEQTRVHKLHRQPYKYMLFHIKCFELVII